MNFMIKYTKIMDTIQAKAAIPLKWGLFAFMSLICFEVFMRYVMQAPTIWGLDFRQQIYAVLIMLGSAYTLMVKGHVIVDTFTMQASFRGQKLISMAMWLILYMPPMVVLTYTMYNLTALAWRLLEGSGTIWNPPVYPLKTLLSLAYANMVLQGVAEFFKDFVSYVKGSEDWIKER
jgi:TRAP-type mannitol/chloroaromatic compound transport system permease small subunit